MTTGSGAGDCVLRCGGGFDALAALNFNVDVNERESRRRHAGDTAGLSHGLRADSHQLLLHFSREAADRLIVEPYRDAETLRPLQLLDRFALLVEITGVLDFGFDGAEFVARARCERRIGQDGCKQRSRLLGKCNGL